MFKFTLSALQVSLLVAASCATASAQSITVVAFGGEGQASQAPAYYEPFEKATGAKVVAAEYNGELGKVKSMVNTNSVQWDVVQVESPELERGCAEGIFEKLDYSKIMPRDAFIDSAAHDCGVGTIVWSVVMAYNTDKIKDAPSTWADFWNVQKYPGKRALRKGAKYNLEFALMADGVPAKDVYTVLGSPEGVDRAFKKLDEIKSNIQWWESGAQPQQYLVAGDVVMSSAYNARVTTAVKKDNRPLALVWPESIYALDYWAIPKGSKNTDLAQKFIQVASESKNLIHYSELMPYGPTTKESVQNLPPALAETLPSSEKNMEHALALDVDFWTDYGESLEQRYNAWVAQ